MPDINLEYSWNAWLYRCEPSRFFDLPPNIRPSVLYVMGKRSQNPNLKVTVERLTKMAVGWGGNGSVKLGMVK